MAGSIIVVQFQEGVTVVAPVATGLTIGPPTADDQAKRVKDFRTSQFVITSDTDVYRTHDTLVLAEPSVANTNRILILESHSLGTGLTFTEDNLVIEIETGVTLSGTGTALTITGNDCTIRGGRFSGFTTMVDNQGSRNRFYDMTADTSTTNVILDTGSKTTELGNIKE